MIVVRSDCWYSAGLWCDCGRQCVSWSVPVWTGPDFVVRFPIRSIGSGGTVLGGLVSGSCGDGGLLGILRFCGPARARTGSVFGRCSPIRCGPLARPVIRVPAVLTRMTAKLPRRNVIATASRISNTYGEGNRERTTYGRRTIDCAAPSVPDTDLHACHAGSDGVPRIPIIRTGR